MKKVVDRPFNASLRRYVLNQLSLWDARIDRCEDLRTAWHMRGVLLGILYRAGYIVVYDRSYANPRLVVR